MTFTKEHIIEELKASTQNASGMFEISEDTICNLMSLLTAPPAPVSVPSGYSDFEEIWSSSTHPLTQDDEMKDFAWHVWNACRAAMLQGAEPVSQHPELTVWYGSMPETNGKTNWTAILHRKGERLSTGITIERSEYPDRVRYEADRVRHIIGELKEQPDILAYDADAHSGYVKPGNSPVIPDGWVACSERMPEETVDADGGATCYLVLYAEGRQPNGGSNVQVSNVTYLRRWHEGMISHWMPLPAAPQQEVNP